LLVNVARKIVYEKKPQDKPTRLFERRCAESCSRNNIVADGMLGSHGFDAEREVAGITLNRWPHGYAYEFEGIGVPGEYDRYNGPHIAGRAQLGRISIANSDPEAYAYVQGAVDAADRAVNEQIDGF
jgi:hypothetical protein